MPVHVTVPRVLIAIAAAAAIVDAALYGTALAQLQNGPDAVGYDLLAWANKLASIVAILAVAVVAARAFAGGRILVPSMMLLLSSGLTGAVALGLFALGRALLRYEMPQQLQSLLLAVQGTGQDLAAVPMFLVAGAAVLPFVAFVRTRRLTVVAA